MPEHSILTSPDFIQRMNQGAEPMKRPLYTNFHSADRSVQIILESIHQFEQSLDNDHEVSIKLASFGSTVILSVCEIGYANPDILIFRGYVDSQFATLIQHVSQLNFLLLSVPKSDPQKPPRRIGFYAPTED